MKPFRCLLNELFLLGNSAAILTLLAVAFLMPSTALAYDVWIGTHCTSKNAAQKKETWNRTAELVKGLNAHTAAAQPSPGTPNENDGKANNDDWYDIFTHFNDDARTEALVETARSGLYSPTKPNKPKMNEFMENKFKRAADFGYEVTRIMFYNNKQGDVSYNWTDDEIQGMRDWLDKNSHSDVRLVVNLRNYNSRTMCEHPLVDDIMLEAAPDVWFSNTGRRKELLKWLWSNDCIKNKKLIFQIPTQHDPYDNPSAYQKVRRLIVWLGSVRVKTGCFG